MSDPKQTLKIIGSKAILGTVVIAGLFVFLHYIIIALWTFFNYNEHSLLKVIVAVSVGTSFSFFVYSIWAIRRIIVKTYLIVHERHIDAWVQHICLKQSEIMIEKGQVLINEDLFLNKVRIKLNEKVDTFPKWLRKLCQKIINRIKIVGQLNEAESLLKAKDKVGLAQHMSIAVNAALFKAAANIIPPAIKYVIPINIILLILIWFI